MTHSTDSFWSKVDRRSEDECWLWTGKNRAIAGYGRLDIWGEEGVYAPRVAYLIAHPGSITLRAPKDRTVPQFIRHTCDNPPCCNPRHLLLGSHADNVKDLIDRKRWPKYSGSNSPRAKLSDEDVRDIRRLKKSGATINALVLLYEISKATISGVLYGRHYKDVL